MKREEARERAAELVGRMTLEEKASQLRFDAPAIERLGVPAYNWWNEALHGVARAGTATMFPQAIGMAASFDPDIMEEIGAAIAEEGRAKYNAQSAHGDRDIYKGLTFWSPNVNIFRDPRWGRGHETYGEDPYLSGRLGVRFIKGLQGDGPVMKAAACAKHFCAHSGPEALRHEFDAVVSPKDLEETYLPAFEACVKEGHVEAVMGAYNRVNGEPACGSPALQEILRGRWGFEGHYLSDCWAVRDFHEHHRVTKTPEESVKLALENGTDLNCGCTYTRILEANRLGLLGEAYITESCIRLFTTRFLLGMFEETEYDKIPYSVVECPQHVALAHRAAAESMVLLKNNGVLPISNVKRSDDRKVNRSDDRSEFTIAVIGPNANSRAALVGNYHGTSSRYVTVLEGIMDRAEREGIRVYYSEGCHLFKDRVEDLALPGSRDRLAEALTISELADLIILVPGLDETLEGEEGDTGNSYASGDKADLSYPEPQRKLMTAILDHGAESGTPVVVVNMTGSSMDLCEADRKASAILQAWYPGARGGADVAGILFGDISPSGKLPVTFYRNCDDLPPFEDYSMKGRTYRYFDKEPLYPFGYGLTYGDCSVQEMSVKIQKAEKFDDAAAYVSVRVVNNGEATEDVLQIYIHDEEYQGAIPNPALCGFARIRLEKGENREVMIPVRLRAFTSVDESGVRAVRSRKFRIWAGFSQPDPRSGELTGNAVLTQVVELAETDE